MAKKTQQHVVPKVYLKAFTTDERPEGHSPTLPYSPALWLIPRSLEGAPHRRSPGNVLRKLNAYTLKGDKPGQPYIEDQLSRLESAYAAVIRKIPERAELTLGDCELLALFVATLFLRSPAQMTHWQRQLDGIQRLYRQVDRAHNGDERHSDSYWEGADEGGKRLVLEAGAPVAEALTLHGWRLLVNQTSLPFITSDRPVVHRKIHEDELRSIGFPGEWLEPGVLPNRAEFLSHCALSPDVAFVACSLFSLPRTLYWLAPHEALVANLNLFVRDSAQEWLVASSPKPFGELTSRIVATVLAQRAALSDDRGILNVYTDTTRVQLRVDDCHVGRGEHVLNGRLTFRTQDMEALRVLASANHLTEVTYQLPGGTHGGLRDARLIAVALSAAGESVIINGPIFGLGDAKRK